MKESFVKHYFMAWMMFSDFDSKTTRAEFAAFAIPHLVIGAALAWMMGTVLSVPFLVYLTVSIVPAAAVGVRRLNDAGLPRWYIFAALVPIVRGLLLVLLLAEPSKGQRPQADHGGDTPAT